MLSCEFLGNFKNTYSVEHLITATSENKSKRSAKFSQFLFNVNQLLHFDLIEVNESRYNHRGITPDFSNGQNLLKKKYLEMVNIGTID